MPKDNRNNRQYTLETLSKEYGVQFYNFRNVKWFGSNDNETLDGFHANEVSYARIALELEKGMSLNPYIDNNKIIKFINKENGDYGN